MKHEYNKLMYFRDLYLILEKDIIEKTLSLVKQTMEKNGEYEYIFELGDCEILADVGTLCFYNVSKIEYNKEEDELLIYYHDINDDGDDEDLIVKSIETLVWVDNRESWILPILGSYLNLKYYED